MYYGVGDEPGETPVDPCDINGAHFKPEAYMEKLLKEKSLTELMDKESDVTKRKDVTAVVYGILHGLICFCNHTVTILHVNPNESRRVLKNNIGLLSDIIDYI